MDRQRRYKVAAIQFEPERETKAANVARMERLVRDAAANGARIVVLPEMATIGLFWQDRDEIAPYVEPVPGQTTDHFAALARELDIYIALGLGEVDPHTCICFNCAVLVGPEGLIGRHRKVHSYLSDPLWAADGDLGFQVWETPLGRLGMMICMDANYPESGRLLALAGAEVMLIPVGWVEEVCPAPLWIMRAFDNNLPAIVANRWGMEYGQQFSGGSTILNGDGTIQACLQHGTKDEIVYGEIDLDTPVPAEFHPLAARHPELYGDLVLNRFLWNPFDMHRVFSAYPLPDGAQFCATACQLDGPTTLEAEVHRLDRMIATEKDAPPRLFVLPEFSFTTPPQDRQQAEACAETLDGVTVTRLVDWCAATDSYVVAGLVEQDGAHLYNTLVLVGPHGLLAYYRKTHLSDTDQHWASAGNSFAWADTSLGRIGLLAGTDLLVPEAARCLAMNAVDVVCVSATLPGPIPIDRKQLSDDYEPAVHWHFAQTRASENDIYIVFANRADQGNMGASGVFFGPILFAADQRQSLAIPLADGYSAQMTIDTRRDQPFRSKPGLARRLPGQYAALVRQSS